MAKLINKTSIKNDRGDMTYTTYFRLEKKENPVDVIVKAGEMLEFETKKTLGEMIVSSDTAEGFLAEVVLQLEMGRLDDPVVYQPLYETISNRAFPEVLKADWVQYGKVVFLEHIEGEEIKFGILTAEEGNVAYIKTYAAGWKYTEDIVEYNKEWTVEILNRAMGRAYNALLNHLHLYPIISYSYTSANKTSASTIFALPAYPELDPYTRYLLAIRQTILDAIKATKVKDSNGRSRSGSNTILCNSADTQYIQEAISDISVDGKVFRAIGGITQIIEYDGYSETIDSEAYSYTGVTEGKCYLCLPKQYLKELVKHDLIIDSDNADLSRLIEQEIVGRTRRGVYAGVAQSVEEITLPDLEY